MTTQILDIEALLVSYLAPLTETNVATRNPDSRADRWTKLTQLDAKDVTGADSEYLIEYMVQLDCYVGEGETSVEAFAYASEIRKLLSELPANWDGPGVVSRVKFASMPHLPDTGFEPARERYVITAMVTAHGSV